VGDLDKDGWQDLLLITSQGLRVYHNNQGTGFTEVAASVGLDQSPRDLTLADVNGDSWLDVIEVDPNKLSVFINTNGEFSSGFSTSLQYGYLVAAGDVNSDNRPDVYVMRGQDAAGANAPDQVYLNGGVGSSFIRMSSIPSTSQGEADFVAPLDYDGNGLTDFLVLNGGGEEGNLAGPVELIAFVGSTTPADTTAPKVMSTSPGNNTTGIVPGANVTATFSEAIDGSTTDGDPSTIDATTFQLFRLNADGTTSRVTAAVSYDVATKKAILNPSTNLSLGRTYRATMTTGAQDVAGNRLDQDQNPSNGNQPKNWKFTVRR
jgi:hypothetical protein